MDRAGCLDSGRIRVLVALEVRVLREGLASVLRRWPEMAIVEPSPGNDCLKEGPKGDSVDVVLLDVIHLHATVVDRIRELRSTFSGAKVIVIGVREMAAEILACIEAGASGYTLLDSPLDHLVDTIRTVHRGEALCPPDILALLFERIASLKFHLSSVQDSELSKLTPREIEILQLISNGMSNREIGTHLHLELQTVKNYIHSILEKLKVHNRREAAVYLTSESSHHLKTRSASNTSS